MAALLGLKPADRIPDAPRSVETWRHRQEDLSGHAGKILDSKAFGRLEGISFLGILSPKYALGSSLCQGSYGDGSRADHSRGVASIALDFARHLDLSEDTQRYAVTWGLTHDIATWPLSHTSEPAFEEILKRSARQLRRDIVLGERVQNSFVLKSRLRQCGVDPKRLLSLFDRHAPPAEGELQLLWQLIHSPITPDTLEGISRAGYVFGVDVPNHESIRDAVWRDGCHIRFAIQSGSPIAKFWKAKGRVYKDFINRPDVVQGESVVARDIHSRFRGSVKSSGASLRLSERELLVWTTPPCQLSLGTISGTYRYKPPQDYRIDQGRWSRLGSSALLESLSEILIKSPQEGPTHASIAHRAAPNRLQPENV